MKIAFVDTYPIRRGAQVFVAELSEALEELGVETARFYLYQNAPNSVEVNLRVQDRVFGFSSTHFFEKVPTVQPQLLKSLAQALLAFQPDIILLNGSRTLKYGAALKRFFPIKAKFISRVIDDAEFWNPGKFTHWYYKNLVIPQLDGTVGVSKASLDSMIRHYKFQKPSMVIHRVFDPKKFENAPSRQEARERLGLGEKEELILFLGNLTAQKRPDRFIKILEMLSKTHPRLKGLIVGDGDLGISIKSQISNLKSPILFFGYQQDVSPYLAAADLLVLTSDTEGLPGVVLEAAYFEVPTVATEVGGIRECLMDKETGFIVPDRSVEGFCDKISFLLNNSGDRIRMGKTAKNFISQNFQMEKVAASYLEFFKKLMET